MVEEWEEMKKGRKDEEKGKANVQLLVQWDDKCLKFFHYFTFNRT